MFVPVPTPAEMSRWDASAIALGIPEDVLMENAARCATDCLRQEAARLGGLPGLSVLLLAGGGNNGGDAFCMARHLQEAGARPFLVCTRRPDQYRGAASRWLRVAMDLGVPVFSSEDWMQGHEAIPDRPDIVVDGLLGTGFSGALREKEARLVAGLNALRAPLVLSVDVPSGLDALTGRPCPDAVRAHVTVTFQSAKPGLVLPESEAFTGRLEVRTIGMPRRVQEKEGSSFRTWLFPAQLPCGEDRSAGYAVTRRLTPDLAASFADSPARPASGPAHKGEAGRVLVIGGCAAYVGAPCLAGLAALRAGAGLVTVAGPRAVLDAVRLSQPALITQGLAPRADDAPEWSREDAEALAPAVLSARAAVFGPGLGRTQGAADFAEALLSLPGRPPLVLDADALFALASRPALLASLRPCDILTPHPGEAATLLGIPAAEVQADRFAALERLAALAPAVWVLKGAGTLVAAPGRPSVVSPWDVPQLAVAGSGDVLAGLAGALLARGLAPDTAAALAVSTHALAGMMLAERFPVRGNGPHDIANALPAAMARAGIPHREDACPCS